MAEDNLSFLGLPGTRLLHFDAKVGDIKMRKQKKHMPGYLQAVDELQTAILYSGHEYRTLTRNLKELKQQLRYCNHPGGAANLDNYLMEYLRKDMALNLQSLIRSANAARQAVLAFIEANRNE